MDLRQSLQLEMEQEVQVSAVFQRKHPLPPQVEEGILNREEQDNDHLFVVGPYLNPLLHMDSLLSALMIQQQAQSRKVNCLYNSMFIY